MKRFNLSSKNKLVYKLRTINDISKKQYNRSMGLKFYNFFINILVSLGCNDIRTTIPLTTHFSHNGVGVIISPDVHLGEHCIIGQNVTLGERKGGVPTLGDGVIIHAHSIILGNIQIGDFSVIGAGSVVLEDIPKWSIAKGNPAKVVRTLDAEKYCDYRFGKEIKG